MERFAAKRNWQQFHTPRNLLLALVGEVRLVLMRGGIRDCGVLLALANYSNSQTPNMPRLCGNRYQPTCMNEVAVPLSAVCVVPCVCRLVSCLRYSSGEER